MKRDCSVSQHGGTVAAPITKRNRPVPLCPKGQAQNDRAGRPPGRPLDASPRYPAAALAISGSGWAVRLLGAAGGLPFPLRAAGCTMAPAARAVQSRWTIGRAAGRSAEARCQRAFSRRSTRNRRPPITARLCPRPLEIPGVFLRVCVLAWRRRRPLFRLQRHEKTHSDRRGEREGHADLGPPPARSWTSRLSVICAISGRPRPRPGLVGPREHPATLVRHRDDDRLRLAVRAHLDRPGLVAVQVGVEHRVGDRLGDGERHGGERMAVAPAEAANALTALRASATEAATAGHAQDRPPEPGASA